MSRALPAQQLAELLSTALAGACEDADRGAKLGNIHYNRSRNFLRHLTAGFRAVYSKADGFNVFAGGDHDNRRDFNRNEYLYDLSVYECGRVPEGYWGAGLSYVRRAVWQVESEFERTRRAAMADFNKLVLGSGDNKLFVCSRTKSEEAFLEPLGFPAAHATGRVYAAVLPHPAKWKTTSPFVHLWQWGGDEINGVKSWGRLD